MSRLDQRSSLDTLTKARLLELAAHLGVEVASSQTKAEVVDTLAASKRASFEQILLTLSRDELKAICRGQGASDKGREKQGLVDRILGREAASRSSARVEKATGSSTASAKPRRSTTLDENRRYRALEPGEGTSPAKEVVLGYGPAALQTPKKRGRKPRAAGDEPTRGERSAKAEGDAVWTASTKMRLRRFSIEAAGGYRGREAEAQFAQDLIRCFGWGPDDALPAEIPAVIDVVERGQRAERQLGAWLRERRAVVEIIDRERSTSEAWNELLPVLLQLAPAPQYVVLCNQRDVALYDFARSRTAARLELPLDELPKYSEAFPFLARDWSPGATPQIINVERVSTEVAELVARVYRSFAAQHPGRLDDVIRFTLQCIIAMFAEDIGLLPKDHFTALLYQAAAHGDAEARLGELFRKMSEPGEGDRVIRYFNGGLFGKPVVLPVNKDQLTFLTKASEANWTYVDPHIFGAVFQGIMDEAERHAQGAHYTSKEDIMRVVGPTIVEPWRRRIGAASSLTELRALRVELTKFRVLDPACGSGNFLYIAFRELYRLETELLSRMREFPSVGDPAARGAWGSGISATNFYGIDINPFAVELARATLNIAKKIAFEERRQHVADKFSQLELELDPSLPLDNLEKNIVCKDALFMEWPAANAIVGNPPFLGVKRLRAELGATYVERLKAAYPGVGADLCVYWFRRSQDSLVDGGRAGLVATSAIRADTNRTSSIDYIVDHGGTITHAVSQQEWPGEAMVSVSMVCWVKGPAVGPHVLVVDGRQYELSRISPRLELQPDVGSAKQLLANVPETSQGVTYGTKHFYIDGLTMDILLKDEHARPWIRAVANGDDLLRGKVETSPDHAVHLACFTAEADAHGTGGAFTYVRQRVLPWLRTKAGQASTPHYENWLRTWWRPFWHRHDFLVRTVGRNRIIACSRSAARPIFMFVAAEVVLLDKVQIFNFDDDYSFGILQSDVHWSWVVANGGRQHDRRVYTTHVWKTFPWPQQPPEQIVVMVCEAARALRNTRRELMAENSWSLRALHQAADVPGPHPLKEAQARLNEAVAAAYDLPAGQEPLEFLLELNLALAEDEATGHPVVGPGLPPGYDPKDPRWHSTDCIEPPRLDARTKTHDG